jgi:hypothetical protein
MAFCASRSIAYHLACSGGEFSADVERARDIHGEVIERRGVIEDDQVIGLDLVAVGKIVPGIDVLAGAHNGRVRNSLGSVAIEIGVGAGLNFVLKYSGMGVCDSFAIAFGAEFAVPAAEFRVLWRFLCCACGR